MYGTLTARKSFIKKADPSQSTDQPFEQSLSSLAHTYLRDKCPRLLDYEVGFQLLEKNDDDTRAVGVFGFKIGPQWAYVPIFYLNGSIKGQEMLYLKNKDLFVPLSENWTNYLLGKKPQLLGDEVGRNLGQLGIQHPSLFQLARTPAKYASVEDCSPDFNWRQDARARMAFFSRVPISQDPAYRKVRDLSSFFKEAGRESLTSMLSFLKAFPGLVSSVEKTCGADCLSTWTKAAVSSPNLERDKEKPKVNYTVSGDLLPGRKLERSGESVVYARYRDGKVEGDISPESLTEKEKINLLGEGYVLRDIRKGRTSKTCDIDLNLKLDNPSETGVYKVLVGPDTFKHCLVVMQPASPEGHGSFCTLVELESKNWLNVHPTKVWTSGQMSDEAFKEWCETLPEAKVSEGKTQLLILPSRQGTTPFEVREALDGPGDGSEVYQATFRTYVGRDQGQDLATYKPDMDRRNYDPKRPWMHNDSDFHTPHSRYGSRLRFMGTAGKRLIIVTGEVQVPDTARLLTLADGKSPLDLGSPADLRLWVDNNTAQLRLHRDGPDSIHYEEDDGEKTASQFFDKLGCLLHLTRDCNLPVDTAEHMVKKAMSEGQCKVRLIRRASEKFQKQAGPYGSGPANMIQGAPGAPNFPEPQVSDYDAWSGGVVPVQTPYNVSQIIPEMSGHLSDRNVYNPLPQTDWQAFQSMAQAAQTGQREVFDTAGLGALLKVTSDDNLVDRWRPDLIKGNDRIGRILFNLYWHRDKFAERYGKNDVPRIEDGLRSVFKSLGDLILDLDQRDIKPLPSEDQSGEEEGED